MLDRYVTRDEVKAIYLNHGFKPDTWASGGATKWTEAWGDRWSSTCLLLEYGKDNHVGFDLSNYGDGVELAPADHALPALGEVGHIRPVIGYVIWAQDGWRLSIEGENATEDDLQASVELAMLVHDRISEGGTASLPTSIDHDVYLEKPKEKKQRSASDPATIQDFFMGTVDFRITTDNGYVWEPTLFIGPPGRYADSESSINADCSTSDTSVIGVVHAGIDAGSPPAGSNNDVDRTLTWEFGGYPTGTVISGGECWDAESGMSVTRGPGDDRLGAAGELLLPGFFSPAQPGGDLEAFYRLTVRPTISEDTMQALGIDDYEVEVVQVSFGIHGEAPVVNPPTAAVAQLDGTFKYAMIKAALNAASG